MGILSWYLDKRRDRQAGEEFRDYYGELLNQQNFQQGVVEPATRGIGILPGVNSVTAGAESGAIPIDPESGGARDIMNRGGNITPPSMDLLRHPVYGQMARDLFMEAVKNNPAILAAKNRQELQQEIQKAILSATGQKVDQNLLGLDELEKTAKNPSLLPRDRILQNIAEKEGITTTAQEQAKEPFRDIAMQRSINIKGSPTWKQTHGGGGGEKEKKPKELSKSNLQNIRFLIHDAKPDLYGEDFNEKGDMVSVPTADTRWIETRAKHYMSKERLGEVSAVERAVQDFEERQKERDAAAAAERQGRRSDALKQRQEVLRQRKESGITVDEFGNPITSAPAAPAPQQRAAEVQTGRDPATENKIRVLRQKGISPEQIKQALKEDGFNPADYGY